jgi:hypothetical protein
MEPRHDAPYHVGHDVAVGNPVGLIEDAGSRFER